VNKKFQIKKLSLNYKPNWTIKSPNLKDRLLFKGKLGEIFLYMIPLLRQKLVSRIVRGAYLWL